MGFFDYLQRQGVSAIRPEAATIRTIDVKSNTTTATRLENGRGSEKPKRSASVGSIGQAKGTASHSQQPRRQELGRDVNGSSDKNGRESLKRSSTMDTPIARQRPVRNDNAPRPFVRQVRSPSRTSTKRMKKDIDPLDYSRSHSRAGGDRALLSPDVSVAEDKLKKLQNPYTSRSQSRENSVVPPAKSTSSVASASKVQTTQSGASSRFSHQHRSTPPSTSRWWSSSDESDSDTGFSDDDFDLRKRVRVAPSTEPDLKRRVRYTEAFVTGDRVQDLDFVHAIDITRSTESRGAFGDDSYREVVGLQYPSSYQKERYELMVPRDSDALNPIDEIVHSIDTISDNYVPSSQRSFFHDASTGIKRRLRRALAHKSQFEFKQTLNDFNETLTRLVRDGSIASHLDAIHGLPLSLVECILTQTYSRTVSPRVESLRRYENGSDNVYGELLPRFVADISRQTKLKSDQVFVDLGSGVGNVVLQAALEIGCESWGCEMMQNACDLAELQQKEFSSRCSLWGLSPGSTHLVRGDFLEEKSIIDVLHRADVILINNQAFTPQLNDKIVNFFLEMKEGAQIVSLKSFVPSGHRITARNFNSPVNLLNVRRLNYWSDCVSWTDAGGSYFIATKDSSRLMEFARRMA